MGHAATSARPAAQVALVTCAEVPDLDPDTRLLIEPLAARGVTAVPAVWDDPHVDWSSFDLAIVRSCWDYSLRRDRFLGWARQVPRLANPADVLAWNTDKRYLHRLAASGIPVVPTTWLAAGQAWTPPEQGEWVVKPAVSLASMDTGRYRCSVEDERRLAAEHVRRLHRAGRTVMVQPYLGGVDTQGETSLIFLGGVFSHAIRRAAALTGPDTGIDRRFSPGGGLQPRHVRPTATQLTLATRVLAAAITRTTDLLYARVDLLPGRGGNPILIEIELTEPQLFLGALDGIADRMADTVVHHIDAAVRSAAAPIPAA